MTEQELLVDCLQRLNALKLEYYLTGSMASNYWGVPRTTHDLDFVIVLPPGAVSRFAQGFSPEYYVDQAMIRAAQLPPHQFNVIDSRSSLKVDFWTGVSTPFEREIFKRKLKVRLFGEEAWIATGEDVILHKLVWDRISPSQRQLGDIAGILLVQKTGLDWDYMRKWANELGVSEQLEACASGKHDPKRT